MKKKIRPYRAPSAPTPAASTLCCLSSLRRGLVLATAQPTIPEVHAVLRGQCVLIVGGDPRPTAIERLRKQLELASLEHCATKEGDASSRAFARRLDRLDPLLVIWICGLSRTSHGIYLHARCRELEIPHVDCIRIPHANTLVAEVLRLRLLGSLRRRWFALRALPAYSGGGAP
jgi:hypothetical protein